MTRGIKKTAAALAASSALAFGIALAASPAQAHNANYNCTTWFSGETAVVLHCAGGVGSDSAVGRVKCLSFTGTVTTKYTAPIRNGQTSVTCNAGSEAFERAYRETYTDGHSTAWIVG